jgi:hypothetical protein
MSDILDTPRGGEPANFLTDAYLAKLLQPKDETPAQARVRECLVSVFRDRDPVEGMLIAGELIEYARDYVLSGMAAIRRTATVTARITMSPDEIAQATGLSRATVSRLITEYREV